MTKILSNKSNIDLDYPICRPSLDLDFTQEVLDPRITFSRGSIGTRVNRNRLIETVSANQPRFDYDPVTGECKGLLIEESRQNLLTYSEDFSNAIYSIGSGSISTNTITAPDGNITADAFIENTTSNAYHFFNQFITKAASSITYTLSIFVKSKGGRRVGLRIESGGAGVISEFNVVTGTNTAIGTYNSGFSNPSSSIIKYPNDWYRITLTVTSNTSTSLFIQLYLISNTTNSSVYTGDGTSGLYLWGAQLEAGAFATSYIPTIASTVTRSVDNASMTGTNFSSWYNQSEGTVYTKANSNNLANGGTIFIASNASYTERYAQLGLTGNVGYGYGATWFTNNSIIGGGAFTLVGDTYANGAYKKIAVSGIAGNFNGVSGNQILSSKKTNLYPSGITQARIGSYNNNVSYLNGTISRLTYYPRALKPNQLQYLTQ
jgi:hypothetical protein